jgi:enoyl-CoA hydratase
MDMILTGREVAADEALAIGLVNRVVPSSHALDAAISLAAELAELPQTCLRHDRLSAIEQWGFDEQTAMRNELRHGLATIASGEPLQGADRFRSGAGRHGAPFDPAAR